MKVLRISSNQGRRNAFKIVELVIVVMIIAILAVNAVPRFSEALSRQRLRSAAQHIKLNLEDARMRARHHSRSFQVVFSLDDNSVAIPSASGVKTVRLGEAPYQANISAVAFGMASLSEFEFDGFGSPNEAGTITIRSGAFQQTIHVATESGVVTLGDIEDVQ